MSTVLAVKLQSFVTFRHRADTGLAAENGSGRTLGLAHRDTFAVQQLVTEFTFLRNQVDAFSVVPLVVWWAFGILVADALLAVEARSFQACRDTYDAAANSQCRSRSALRGKAGDAFALSGENCPKRTDGVAAGDTACAIEDRIPRAGGEIGGNTLLAVEGAALFGTFGNAGDRDTVIGVESESFLADWLGCAETDTTFESGSRRTVGWDNGNAVSARKNQSGRTLSLLDCGAGGSVENIARPAFRELGRHTATAVQLVAGGAFGDLYRLLLADFSDLSEPRGAVTFFVCSKYTHFAIPRHCGRTTTCRARDDVD